MNYRIRYPLLLVLLTLHVGINNTGAVVVDGGKKQDISATKNQSDEKSMIDSFNTKTCGMADPNFDEHEFVNMAREGQFPWMASFQIKILGNSSRAEEEKAAHEQKTKAASVGKKLEDLHFCGGSFISDKWILSAAHCFAPETIKNYLENDKLKVVAGSHKVSSRSPNNQNLTIEKIYYHSQFDKSVPVGFDIALVELRDRVTFSQKRVKSNLGEQIKPFMNTICLPLKDKKYKFNETARIAGWGLSSEKDASSMPTKLLVTDILLGKMDNCVENYVKSLKSDRARQQREKYDDFICASYKNTRDACQSDSGGPLMQFAGGKAVAIGIISYGIGCATKGVPGLYTRTSAYINWIKDITKNGKDASVAFRLIEAKQHGNGSVAEVGTSESAKVTAVSSTTTTTNKPETSSARAPNGESHWTAAATTTRSSTTSVKPSTSSVKPASSTSTTLAPSSTTSTTKKRKISAFKFFDE